MKKILSLVIMTACLAGCGSAARVSQNENTVDVGYGVQDQDKVTTAVSNVKVKKRDAQTYSSMYDYLRGRVAGVIAGTYEGAGSVSLAAPVSAAFALWQRTQEE